MEGYIERYLIKKWPVKSGEIEDPNKIALHSDDLTENEAERFLSERSERLGPLSARDKTEDGEIFYEARKYLVY